MSRLVWCDDALLDLDRVVSAVPMATDKKRLTVRMAEGVSLDLGHGATSVFRRLFPVAEILPSPEPYR